MIKLKEMKQDSFYRMFMFLHENGQHKLAWRLWRLEARRVIILIRKARVARAQKKLTSRWNDFDIDLEHYMLIRKETK